MLIYTTFGKKGINNTAETELQVVDHIKEAVKFRIAGMQNIENDPVNRSLCNNWGLSSLVDSFL